MKFTSALSAVLVLLPAVTNAIVIPAPVGPTEVQRRDDILAREIEGGIVARQNGRNGRNGRNGNNNGNGNNRGGNNNNAANNGANNAANNGANNPANNGANNAANNGTNNAANNGANNAANNGTNNAANNGANNPANNGANNAANNGANNAANNGTANAANNGNNNNNNNNGQDSLTLDPSLVATGLEQDGQNPPVAGQVASLTSKNNFMNFCAGQTITNGQQIKTGSCNPVPMGDIIPQANMPSSKFTFPTNFGTVQANKAFTATIAVQNMETGHFTNAQKNYFAAPQQLNGQNILVAHSHMVIQKMGEFGSPAILDPTVFAFFKGLNAPAQNGILSADVTDGLAPGNYRIASIHTGANHAPAVAAVAQHGFFDDMVYFTAQ